MEIGDKFTTTFKDELLCCPLLLLTFKLAVVDEIGLLYVTVWGPIPLAVAGIAPTPKFQV